MEQKRRQPAWAALGLCLAAVLVLSGCSSAPAVTTEGGTPTPASTDPAASDTPSFADEQRDEPSRVTVEVTGDVAFTWEAEEMVTVTHVGGPEIPVNLLSAGFLEPKRLDDPQNRFRWAFDLIGAYDGPGTYEFDGEADNQGIRSVAFLIYMRVEDGEAEAVFDMDEVESLKEYREIVRPCTLEVGEEERSGTLTCPELATEDGETVAMTVHWEPAG